MTSGTRELPCMTFLKLTARDTAKLTFTSFFFFFIYHKSSRLMILVTISLCIRKTFKRKKKKKPSDGDCTCCLSVSIYSHVPTCRIVWKPVIGVPWGDACWETDERVQAARRTSSASVSLSSLSVCVRVLPIEFDAWLWVIQDGLKDSPAGETGNREA